MARHTQVILVDDIDGDTADETIAFSLDGVDYQIDLSDDNAAALRDAMAAYVGSARRVGRKRGGKAGAGRATGDTAAIRAWAGENGIAVSKRGRISADVVAQYEAAHGK